MKNAGSKLKKPNFYTELFEYNFNYERFTSLFNNRVKILKNVESKSSINDKLTDEDDISSHFITRLISANDEKTTKWFINQETSLFYNRLYQNEYDFRINIPYCKSEFQIDPLYSKNTFTIEINFDQKVIKKKEELILETPTKKSKTDQQLLVHFSRISRLLAERAFIPVKGYTSIERKGRDALLSNLFRHELELKMEKLSLILKKEPDERLQKLCKTITTEKSATFEFKSSLLADEKYFPPCMQKMIHLMKTKRHLLNNDRQALTLFLKDIKIPVNETIELFRNGFNMNQAAFDKEYLYNIRHSYGLEGKKANYSGFTCSKIINMKNSEKKSCCPCVDDKEFIKDKYKYDIEEIFKDHDKTSRCRKILEKCTNEKYTENMKSPFQYFITHKNMKNEKP